MRRSRPSALKPAARRPSILLGDAIDNGETVVIGTSSLGDKALILVVNAKIGGK